MTLTALGSNNCAFAPPAHPNRRGPSTLNRLHASRDDIAQDIGAHLGTGEDVLVTLGGESSGEGAGDPSLTARLGEILRPCASAVEGLILTGGDTAADVLQAWGANGLRLVEEIDPGVVRSETIGVWTMPVVTKAGSFGDSETLTRARERLRR